jgi:hypothetical protein
MPILTTAANSRVIVLPVYVQLLLGLLLVTLFLCVPIVVYTNHVKGAAVLADPVRSAQASAPETIAPLNIPGPEKLAGAATISPSHAEGSSSRNTTQIHSGTMSSTRTSTPNYISGISGDELAMPKRRTSIRIVRMSGSPTPLAGGRSAGPTLPRAWSRANSSRNGKAVLIATWRQTFKRSQNSKIKSSRS